MVGAIKRMTEPQSQLARHVPRPVSTDAQVLAMGARAWDTQETLVVRLSTIDDPMVKRMVKAVAAYCFGRDHG